VKTVYSKPQDTGATPLMSAHALLSTGQTAAAPSGTLASGRKDVHAPAHHGFDPDVSFTTASATLTSQAAHNYSKRWPWWSWR
jgi:hypothetical protein